MLKRKILIPGIAVMALAAINPAVWCGGAGSSAGMGLEFEQLASARAGGLGQVVSAMEGDINLIHYNPAGIASLLNTELGIAYMFGFGDMQFVNVSYGQPLAGGIAGVSVSYFNAGSIELTGALIQDQVINAQTDLVFTGSYATEMIQGMRMGASIKVLSSSMLQNPAVYACMFDAGVLYRTPVQGLNAGLALQNAGSQLTYYRTPENLPLCVRAGMSYNFTPSEVMAVTAGLDIKYLVNDTTLVSGIGAELKYGDVFSARAGYVIGAAQGLTLGAGFNFNSYIIDYAFELTPSVSTFGNHKAALRILL